MTGNGSGDFYTQNITINNSAGAVLSTPIYLYGPLANGTLTLTSGLFRTSANLTLASKSVISRSGGSISGSPTFSAATDVTYTGSSPITTGPELPSSAGLGNLTINCSGGVTLGGAAPVNGNLILTSGTLSLGSNNLTIASTKTITGASSSNYIVTNGTGYLIQQVPATSTNVTFPVGTSSAYNPVILNNGGTTDNYSVRVASGTANVVSAAGVVADQWTINEAISGGTKSIAMTLQWNGTDEGASFASSRSSGQIGQYSGSGTIWTLMGTTVAGSNPYTASNNSAITTNFSNSIYSVGLNSALPVELTSFTAAAVNSEIELAWATATEINNSGFEVQRSTVNNQQSTINSWTDIAFVTGHGTTNAPQSYSYTDASARVGKYSYRLKQIDNDGKFVYGQVIEATVGLTPGTVFLDNNYPNPFNPSTKISFVLGTTGRATLKVYNLLGQEVATLADGEFNGGDTQTFTFDASKYSSGIYYYQLKSTAGTQLKKMMLLK